MFFTKLTCIKTHHVPARFLIEKGEDRLWLPEGYEKPGHRIELGCGRAGRKVG